MAELAGLGAALATGLLAGSLLTEDRILVPYWRTLSAEDFKALHRIFAPRLFGYFAPLTVLAGLAAVWAAVAARAAVWEVRGSAVLCLAAVATYAVYFHAANQRLAAGSLSPAALKAELARWRWVHRVRTVLMGAAFAGFLYGLAGG